jgi:pimeloyl-ACP methyl ester carboxylesterase
MTKSAIYEPKVPRTERKLSIRGVNYCVHEWGSDDAPLFVYLHGWGDTGSTFQFVVDALSAGWRVVAPDWRGFGRSPCRCTSYWFPDYLADLHALLEGISPDAPLRLVGHSMGANVAALYAGTFPERVQALVDIEGFGLVDSRPADAPSRYRAWIEASNSPLSFSEYDDIASLAQRIARRHPAMAADAAAFVAREWAVQEADGKVRLRADPLHKLPNPVLYRRAEAEACWRAVAADTLLVIGGNSRFAQDFPVTTDGRMFARNQTVVIDGAGHMLHFEVPGPLAAAIEEFLLQPL